MKKTKIIIGVSILLVVLLALPVLALSGVFSSYDNSDEQSHFDCRVYNCPICLPLAVPPIGELPTYEPSDNDLPIDWPQGMTPEMPPIGDAPDQPHRGGLCRMADCPYCEPLRQPPHLISVVLPEVGGDALEFLQEIDGHRFYLTQMISETIFLYFSDGSRYTLRYAFEAGIVTINELIAAGVPIFIDYPAHSGNHNGGLCRMMNCPYCTPIREALTHPAGISCLVYGCTVC
ncbi:MAG: hypothetical protein FWB93_00880 [Oscillospiraceae bacterium]|nr:hypothetical protein [Oscillospiraceae bacterium]